MFDSIKSWLEREVRKRDYGELIVTVKIHDGRVQLIETAAIDRIKPDDQS